MPAPTPGGWGMSESEREVTSCPWCGAFLPVPRHSFVGPGAEGAFLRCHCGAVGLPTLDMQGGRVALAEQVLGVSRTLWADLAWGLENVEWRTVEQWYRLQKLEELVSGPEIWMALLWGRRR